MEVWKDITLLFSCYGNSPFLSGRPIVVGGSTVDKEQAIC